MSDNQLKKHRDDVLYAHRAVHTLSNAWIKSEQNPRLPNLRGMRAEFRRWRPDILQQPTFDMLNYVTSFARMPGIEHEGESNRAIDHAAVLVSLRAIAGETEPNRSSFGAALFGAELSDLRVMRLLSTPRKLRLDALQRAMRLVAKEGMGFKWNEQEIERILDFLFSPSEEQAQRAARRWASDFFAARDKAGKDDNDTPQQPQTTTEPVEAV